MSAGAEGRMPDFFIVGHPKSGTTAMSQMLRRHPRIFLPDLGAVRFFAPEMHIRTTPEDYTALFAAATPGQRVGEVSPSYLWSLDAAERIAESCPQARIVAILREPASFMRSLHLELVQEHVETENDLRRAIARDEALRRERGIVSTRDTPAQRGFRYATERVSYVEQLRRYGAVFPPEQMLVLIYDDFRADNESTMASVLRFLGVEGSSPIAPVEANPTVRVRSLRLYELVRSLYLGRGPAARGVKAAVKTLTPQKLRRDGLALLQQKVLYAEPEPADEQLMLELRRRFKAEVVALSEYLDRDLVTLWGYDGIA